MENLWRTTHWQDNNEYELAISWDDESFIEGQPTIQLAVTVRRGEAEPRSVTAEVALVNNSNDGAPDLVLRIQGKEIVTIPLADLIDETQIIDRIPGWAYGAGDLLTGCLVRGGLSSLLGQVIRCKNSTRHLPWYFPRIQAIGECLKQNLGRIGARTAWRAAKCVITAGF